MRQPVTIRPIAAANLDAIDDVAAHPSARELRMRPGCVPRFRDAGVVPDGFGPRKHRLRMRWRWG